MADPHRLVAANLIRAGAVAAALLLAALVTVGRSEAAFSPTDDGWTEDRPAGANQTGQA